MKYYDTISLWTKISLTAMKSSLTPCLISLSPSSWTRCKNFQTPLFGGVFLTFAAQTTFIKAPSNRLAPSFSKDFCKTIFKTFWG